MLYYFSGVIGLKKDIHINIPSGAEYIIKKLEQAGFEAFVVGGCVRDSIIGRSPQDWDIAVSAKPEEVKRIFQRTIDTGLQHGTVTILHEGIPYEATTYRIDGEYIDNRKPEWVAFTSSIKEDLSRRDFTINAMAYNPSQGLVDPFDGVRDIQQRQIKAVGKAEGRFQEDALRMLRAVRFHAQLGYQIEPVTFEAIRQHVKLIGNISKERIREELTKALLADPMSFVLFQKSGILQEVLPELNRCFNIPQNNPYHIYNVGLHILRAAKQIESTVLLRWVMLLHDLGKADTLSTDDKGINHFHGHQQRSAELAEEILKRLRFDNATIQQARRLILEHDRQVADTEKSVRKAMAAIGPDLFDKWLQIRQADMSAQNPEWLSERLNGLKRIEELYKKVVAEQQCITLKDLKVSGKELMDIGFSPGKELGEALRTLLEAVIEEPALNQKETLLEMAKKYLREQL